ncbi:esterase-like activity of phytase family protein [Gulosibacter bifidus]|uniref:Esterase-like activity of phytase family protein n=1 Tax=Gulosibacter bifidus TaxID=272239 RepID=A0ABW5RHM0_9MICO|nr:esterase-like activity of phytase family protein [Gulosibacter bifidus]
MSKLFVPGAALLAMSLTFVGTAFAGSATAAGESTFDRVATYPVYQNVPEGVDPAAETVAEISTVTPDGNTLIYTDAAGQRIGFLDITDPANPVGTGAVSLSSIGSAGDSPTSVAAFGDYVFVVIDESAGDFVNPKGRVDILRVSDRTVVKSIDLGGQPDSIAISADGKYAAIAMENQRDEEANGGALPQQPSGFVQVIELTGDVATWVAEPISFADASGTPLPIVANSGIIAPEDIEPEYVSINSKNQLAVTLQENNGVAIIDLNTREITKVWSAGTASVSGIDTKKDGVIDLSGSITDVPREPDAIGWVDDNTLATANEGDWNGGTRGWTVFDTNGTVVWDAGNTFEQLAVEHGLYNDGRAGKKGTEPEGLAIAEFNGVNYAFVASERSNFVAVYDMSNPADPEFKQLLFSTNGPEGILPIPSRDLLAVSSETDEAKKGVRSAVNLFQLGADTQPSIVSAADETGAPIGWTALGALTADPTDPNTLYTASDSALSTSWLYKIDVAQDPAVITERIQVMKDGAPATYDIEGVYKRAQGGFWLASEGATGAENRLVRIDDAGNVVEEIALPDEVAAHIGKWGLEGVTAYTDAVGNERVYVAIQRLLWNNPQDPSAGGTEGDNTTRIGQYDVATGTWAWFGYELEPTSAKGDWMGLSEITMVDENTLAVIERDKLAGDKAAVKRVYAVDLPDQATIDAAGGALIPVAKSLAIDVLPMLQETNGWTQEKLEGFTIGADGRVYAVTDNDGLDDANGETVFLRLGQASEYFTIDQPTESPAPSESAPVEQTPTASAPESASATAVATDAAPAAGDLAETGAEGLQVLALVGLGVAVTGGALLLRNKRRDA